MSRVNQLQITAHIFDNTGSVYLRTEDMIIPLPALFIPCGSPREDIDIRTKIVYGHESGYIEEIYVEETAEEIDALINAAGDGYHSEITEYISRVTSAGGSLVSGDAELLNTFVTTTKDAEIWDKIKDCGFLFGGFNGSKVKLKYAEEGIENLTLTNFVAGDYSEALGLKSATAATKKCMTGFIPANHGLSSTNFSMGYFMTEPDITTNYYFMLDNQAAGAADVVLGNLEGKLGGGAATVFHQSLVPHFASMSLITNGAIITRDFLNYLPPNTTNPPAIGLDTEISLFFGRNNGVDLYSKGAISFYFIGEYLTYDELCTLQRAVKQVLIGKGRYTEQTTEEFGYGDSITYGSSATAPNTERFLALLAASNGLRERNLGRSGSRLTHNQGSVPGGHDTRTQIGEYPAIGGSSKIVIQYGVNDALEHTGDGNDSAIATFQTELIEVIQYCQSLGFTDANIQVGSISYLTSGTITETGKQKFVTAARNACVTTGVKYVDVYNYMAANGGAALLSGDGVHPNTSGHAAMATAHETLAEFVV